MTLIHFRLDQPALPGDLIVYSPAADRAEVVPANIAESLTRLGLLHKATTSAKSDAPKPPRTARLPKEPVGVDATYDELTTNERAVLSVLAAAPSRNVGVWDALNAQGRTVSRQYSHALLARLVSWGLARRTARNPRLYEITESGKHILDGTKTLRSVLPARLLSERSRRVGRRVRWPHLRPIETAIVNAVKDGADTTQEIAKRVGISSTQASTVIHSRLVRTLNVIEAVDTDTPRMSSRGRAMKTWRISEKGKRLTGGAS